MYFEPEDGAFSVAPVAEFVERLPFTARDNYDSNTFLVASSEDSLERAIETRRADQGKFPLTVMLIDVGTNRIDLSYRATPPAAGRTFVTWLREQYKIRIRDEDFNDVTANVDPGLVYLFGAP